MIEQRSRWHAAVEAHLQPHPDALLEPETPEREAERRETIALQWARERLEHERREGTFARVHRPAAGDAETALMRRQPALGIRPGVTG